MADIQTVSAAFDLARVAWEACVFLKKVKDADRTSAEIYERATRLNQVLSGLTLALQNREQKGVAPHDDADVESSRRIRRCIVASGVIMKEVESKVGGFENNASGIALLDRVKIAFRQPGIKRLQADLDARVQALQTELSILQLSDHAHTHSTIGTNQRKIIQILSKLKEQMDDGFKVLQRQSPKSRRLSKSQENLHSIDVEPGANDNDENDTAAIDNLADCLDIAAELHERYTSEYAPDDRSIRFHQDVVSEESASIQSTIPSGSASEVPHSDVVDDESDDEDADLWPLEILNGHIDAYYEKAVKERDQGHYNQAEANLQAAIRDCELRQRHYNVEFNDRVKLHEEAAILHQRQHRWAEAVMKIHQLLREKGGELDQIRQNQILAEIYYDRHINTSGPALKNDTNDIESAERHAKKAFKRRFAILKSDELPAEEIEKHNSCIALLVRILETRDKTVEANELTKLLSGDGTSIRTDSLRRLSSNRPPNDWDMIEDKHEILINAIRSGDSELMQSLLNDPEVDIEQLCRQGKTPLMHAVETSDETIIHKLFDPGTREGADVSRANRKGLTALHFAASQGQHDLVRCLLHHDAEIDAKDKRGETPLMKAVQNDQRTIVQILADEGADLDTKNVDEWSLLHHSIRLAKPDMTTHLLDIAPDLRDGVDQAGKTALHYCAERASVEQATALLTHKRHADVNAIDSVSRSPLYLAASNPRTNIREAMVQLLVEHGARIDEARLPPKYEHYDALRAFRPPPRAQRMTRQDSVSTTDTVGTTSTGATRLSRIFSARMHVR